MGHPMPKTRSMRIVGIDVGLRNLALCCIDADTAEIVHWEVLDVLKDRKAKSVSIEKSVDLLLAELGTVPWFGELEEGDTVAIEAQPVGRAATGNVRMKCVSHAIQSFVALRTQAGCRFVNPKTKVGVEMLGEYVDCSDAQGDENTKKRYARHKKAAVDKVGEDVRGTKWEDFFHQKLKKKDDAADAFLLARVVRHGRKAKKRKAPPKKAPSKKKKKTQGEDG